MEAIAHSPSFAKKAGVPQSVGQDFNKADKGKKFGTGGSANITIGGKGQINKQRTRFGSVFGNEKNVPNVNLNKYIGKKEGGIMKHDDMKQDMPMMKKVAGLEATKIVNKHEKSMHKMAKGGVTRADGCVSKGHTKGTMITMKSGGMC